VVFERFVASFVAREVVPRLAGWRVHRQARGHTRHLLADGERGLLRLEPDLLLVRPDGSLLVVDTKWKRLAPGRERASLGPADLYQLYAYGQRFAAQRAILLYPHVDGLIETRLAVLRDVDARSDASIEVRTINLDGLHRADVRARIADKLCELFHPR
jgi:5-methylcytosine-specific restriction enzyme subunit McrC